MNKDIVRMILESDDKIRLGFACEIAMLSIIETIKSTDACEVLRKKLTVKEYEDLIVCLSNSVMMSLYSSKFKTREEFDSFISAIDSDDRFQIVDDKKKK